mmetsp:Transcript_21803/g.46055  ORF Transcript_21803/g.46055 Transcript_21803/m.46055 type:complete len:84 (-) Transcript_21803:1350-1601(-)
MHMIHPCQKVAKEDAAVQVFHPGLRVVKEDEVVRINFYTKIRQPRLAALLLFIMQRFCPGLEVAREGAQALIMCFCTEIQPGL